MSTKSIASNQWPWSELGMVGKGNKSEIKSAYAKRLKSIDQDDPEAFQRLRTARTSAMSISGGLSSTSRPKMAELAKSKPSIFVEPLVPVQHNFTSQDVQNENKEYQDDQTHDLPSLEEDKLSDIAENISPPDEILNQEEVNAFWNDYNTAISTGDFVKAAELLEGPVSSDHHIRWSAERQAYSATLDKMEKSAFKLQSKDMVLFEDCFQWASCGVNLAERLRVHGRNDILLHSKLQILYKKRPSARQQQKFKVSAKKQKIARNSWGEVTPFNIIGALGMSSVLAFIFLRTGAFYTLERKGYHSLESDLFSAFIIAFSICLISTLLWRSFRDNILHWYFSETIIRLNSNWNTRSEKNFATKIMLESWLPLVLFPIFLIFMLSGSFLLFIEVLIGVFRAVDFIIPTNYLAYCALSCEIIL